MGKGKVGSNKYDYTPDKLSANEGMGFNAGNSRFQLNTPGGIMALGGMGGPATWLLGGQELSSQYDTQKKLNQVKPGYEQEAQSQGMQARQQSIASGTGGGGVQSASDIQAYNGVMAQYAALRQALEAARLQQQMQMYGAGAQVAGYYFGGPAGGAAAGAGTNMMGGMMTGGGGS